MTLVQTLTQQPLPVRRAVFGAITLAAGLIVWALFIWPLWYAVGAQSQWRDDASVSLARDRGWVEVAPTLKQRVDALPNLSLQNKFYDADSDSAASNAVQADLTALFAAAHVTTQSLAPIAPKSLGLLTLTGARISATLSIDQLHDFLGKLAVAPRYLHVEHLTISAPQTQERDQNPTLSVTMDIFGVRRAAPQSPTDAPAATTHSESRDALSD